MDYRLTIEVAQDNLAAALIAIGELAVVTKIDTKRRRRARPKTVQRAKPKPKAIESRGWNKGQKLSVAHRKAISRGVKAHFRRQKKAERNLGGVLTTE